MTPYARTRPWIGYGLSLLPVGLFAWHARLFDTHADDAYITFRYSLNLARGLGAVWNPGERVEGYSNPLWMGVLALLHCVLRVAVAPTGRALSAVCAGIAIVAVFLLVKNVTRSLFWATVAGSTLACCSSFAAHARSGLESTAFSMLVILLALALASGSVRVLGCALVAVTLCRFEGGLIAILAAVSVVLGGWNTTRARDFFRAAVVALPPLVVWTVWRILYYRHWVPNSVAAKEGRSAAARLAQGLTYVGGFFDTETVVLGLLGLGALGMVARLARRHARPAPPEVVFLLLSSIVYSSFILWIGGCWMPGWRMMVHIAPAFAAIGAVGASWIAPPRVGSPVPALLLRAPLVGLLLLAGNRQVSTTSVQHGNLAPAITAWRHQVLALAEMGRWLKRSLPHDTLVATVAAGALPYYSDLPMIDVLGLSDAHIARRGNKDPTGGPGHIATDWAYVLARRPDVYVSNGGGGFSPTDAPKIDPIFQGQYVPVVLWFVRTKNPLGSYLTLMIRRERLEELMPRLESQPDVVVVRR